MAVNMQTSIPAIGTQNTANQGNQQSKEVTTNSSNFGSVMAKSVSAGAKSQMTSNKHQAGNTLQTATKGTGNSSNTAKTSNGDQKNDKVQANTKTDSNKQVSSKNTQSQVSNDQMNKLVSDVKDKIADTLDISKEDLENAMVALGLTVQDLFQPNALTQLIVKLSGQEDNTSLITNQDLLNDLKSIITFAQDQLSQLSEETGVPAEQLLAQLNDAVKNAQITGSDDVNLNQEEPVTDNKQDKIADQKQPAIQDNQKDIKPAEDDSTDMKDVLQSKLTVNNQTTSDNNAGNASTGEKNTKAQNNEASTKVTKDFTANLTQNVQQTFETYVADVDTQVDAVNVVRQIVDAVKVTATKELQSIEIQLNPENLGKVNMTVSARNGMITAQITAENEQVKKAIESQLSTLREEFDQQGIKVDAVEVTVRGHEFESNQNLQGGDQNQEKQGKRARRHLNLDSLNDLSDDELSEDEIRVKNLTVNQNSSVEYTA